MIKCVGCEYRFWVEKKCLAGENMSDLRDRMNDNMLVSVIIPVFNTLRYLPTLLKRLQAQTFKYFEVIFNIVSEK